MKQMQIKLKSSSGFTLLEIALVLFIAGGSILMISRFIQLYTINARNTATIENTRMAQKALQEYYGLYGVYPCPADPTLDTNDENYGIVQCRDFDEDDGFDPDACTDTDMPGNISCTTWLSRDADGNDNNDVVLMGIVPFRTLIKNIVDTPYTEAMKKDGYGIMISYAVTEEMTNTNKYSTITAASPHLGAIRVLDENKINLLDPEDSAHFVVYSHGDNGKGGYTQSGQQIENCLIPAIALDADADEDDPPVVSPPGNNPDGTDIELENCDNNDALFIKGIRSLAQGETYFDDILFYTNQGLTPLWKRSLASDEGESFIYNTNLGNVGINTDSPEYQLHVNGNLNADGGARSSGYCNGVDSDTCLEARAIGGSGSDCSDSTQLATGIKNNELSCEDVSWTIPTQSCGLIDGVQSYLNGFSNIGNIRCCTEEGSCCSTDDDADTPCAF